MNAVSFLALLSGFSPSRGVRGARPGSQGSPLSSGVPAVSVGPGTRPRAGTDRSSSRGAARDGGGLPAPASLSLSCGAGQPETGTSGTSVTGLSTQRNLQLHEIPPSYRTLCAACCPEPPAAAATQGQKPRLDCNSLLHFNQELTPSQTFL